MNEERARILNNNDFALLTVVVVFNNVKTSPFLWRPRLDKIYWTLPLRALSLINVSIVLFLLYTDSEFNLGVLSK